MKGKFTVILIGLLSFVLFIVIGVGSSLQIDVSSLLAFNNDTNSQIDTLCQTQSEDMTACNKKYDYVGEVPKTLPSTKDITKSSEETTQLINDSKKEATTEVEKNISNLQVPTDEEDVKDTIVYYDEAAEIPSGIVPNVEDLKSYANLLVYDFYAGEITNDVSRVFIDDSQYDPNSLQEQTVYLNVLQPSGILREYPMALTTTKDTNQFDITPPKIAIDTQNVELTKTQFNDLSNEELKAVLQNKYNFSVVDDYDGDITNHSSVSLETVKYGFRDAKHDSPEIVVNAYDEKYNYSSMTLKVKIVEEIDLNAPTIYGAKELEIYDNSNVTLTDFTKLGIYAYDKEDGDITQNIQVIDDGGYTSTAPGNYDVVYQVLDSSGKASPFYEYTIHIGIPITSCEQLDSINDGLTYYYQQEEDLNCAGMAFSPIGEQFDSFKGGYDGNGYEIENLKISDNEDGYTGLFSTNSGVIKNVRLVGLDLVASAYGGGVTGYNTGEIINTSVEGKLTGDTSIATIGGLAGYSSGVIENSFSVVDLTSFYQLGGIVGKSEYGEINNVYSISKLHGLSDVPHISDNTAGGIAGYSQRTSYKNGYAIVNVDSGYFTNIGGVIGEGNNDSVENYYINSVGQPLENISYVVGENNRCKLTNNYASQKSQLLEPVNSSGKIGVDATLKTFEQKDYYDLLWVDYITQSNFTIPEEGLPFINYKTEQEVANSTPLRGQVTNVYVEPEIDEANIKPMITGPTKLSIQIGEEYDIFDYNKIGLKAYDINGNELEYSKTPITVKNPGGFNNNKAGVYNVTYEVFDQYGRLSDPFNVEYTVIDDVAPIMKGVEPIELIKDDRLNINDPYEMGISASDNNLDITGNIKLVDSGGFKGDGTDDPGRYNLTYIVKDEAGNVSDPLEVVINVADKTYKIKTCEDLISIGEEKNLANTSHQDEAWPKNGNYVLVDDLDCSTLPNGYQPIELEDGAVLNGNNHSISGISIDNDKDNQALISKAGDVTVKNLKLNKVNITAQKNTAILIAQVKGDVIVDNVQVQGSVTGVDNTSVVAGTVDKDGSIQVEGSNFIVNLIGDKSSGIIVGDLEGSLVFKTNQIDVNFSQKENYTYELIGYMDTELNQDQILKLIDALDHENIIKLEDQEIKFDDYGQKIDVVKLDTDEEIS